MKSCSPPRTVAELRSKAQPVMFSAHWLYKAHPLSVALLDVNRDWAIVTTGGIAKVIPNAYHHIRTHYINTSHHIVTS